jgi:general secretion pathway protein D
MLILSKKRRAALPLLPDRASWTRCLRGAVGAALLALAGCATPVIDEAETLARAGRYEEAYARLDDALRASPTDTPLRTAHSRQRDRVAQQALARADMALASGRIDEADRLVERVRALDAQQPRLGAITAQLAGARREQARLAAQRADALRRAQAPLPPPPLPPALAAAYQKPVALEFREAPLRQVFEALARSTGVNFVFDKEVRGDARVTVFLREVTLDEAMKVILATQQLDRKLLNDNTVLVYPNTAAKQREHQELVTRSLYLGNADAKQVLTLVRTMAKTRDLYADERLNVLVVRDTPEVVRLVEQLVATLDLAEPEVMLAVEVMEVASNRLDELGLSWPTSLQYGIPGVSGMIELASRDSFRSSVANPALAATLRGDAGSTNLLANPTIRARNREKARVQIGEKLPVFTTTSTANVGVSTSVTYLDVGLKLEVEPTVQLDGDVTIKVALEVSNLLREVAGPQGSLAYQVGSRSTATSLRLRDGETQVLAGLINDEDRQRAVGLPGLSRAPVVGKLFGVQSATRNKTEVVMLITPHIVRRLEPPSTSAATLASGTDSLPGAASLRLKPAARAGVAAARGGRATGVPAAAEADLDATAEPPPPPTAAPAQARNANDLGVAATPGNTPADVQPKPSAAAPGFAAAPAPAASPRAAATPSVWLSATEQARVGDTVSVTLANRSGLRVSGELVFDGRALQAASGGVDAAAGGAGRAAFRLAPQGSAVVVLRVLAPAVGQQWSVQVQGLAGHDAAGQGADLRLVGAADIRIAAEVRP